MTSVKISHEYEVPDSDIEVLIEMAGYGISYWSDLAIIDDFERTYTVRDFDGDEKKVLTYDQLATTLIEVAIGKHDVGYPRAYAQQYLADLEEGDEYAAGHLDADIADVVVQIAAFGEIVFG